ncbi:uncharacterized protein Z519_07063 [Cladophialophora bantiana CBS 173.52]|uniref:Extracellular membrane protein CFEM domain-containing protein n=1 Tax=Cladophialophora bantiana (strain ATCC 10958 / CBS 173.52 / CDC B-1940 / NIH 8579) TaxID=1442370 RepID=A0A0D2I5C1_CLAB1|nr:uncharacterized protein Z519_07063 [Cladophialophora bantiana CBS 173.52]KIW92079.1 hypothetical protein Z519_07063 [Cladophialophora bantiana CBS 173.52]
MDRHLLYLAWLCSLLFQSVAVAQTNNPKPQEIYTLTAFQEQQTCVQSCFTVEYGCTTDVLGSAIGCSIDQCVFSTNMFGALDSCYCRGDLQAAAESFLTSCIQESCTVGDTSVNIAAAVSIYGGYCTSLGYTALPANNVAETTAVGSNPTTAGSNNGGGAASTGSNSDVLSSNPTGDSASSSSPSGSSSSSSSSSNTTTYIVLGVVGGFALILLVVATLWFKKYRQLKRAQRFGHGHYGAPPPNYGYNNGSMNQPLRPLGGGSEVSSHPFYNRQDDIYPDDSVSTIHVAPAYPHPLEPSLVSTHMR